MWAALRRCSTHGAEQVAFLEHFATSSEGPSKGSEDEGPALRPGRLFASRRKALELFRGCVRPASGCFLAENEAVEAAQGRAEVQVLLRPWFEALFEAVKRLATELSGHEEVEGDVRIYSLRPPCLSCPPAFQGLKAYARGLGAMRQLRKRWPRLTIQAFKALKWRIWVR